MTEDRSCPRRSDDQEKRDRNRDRLESFPCSFAVAFVRHLRLPYTVEIRNTVKPPHSKIHRGEIEFGLTHQNVIPCGPRFLSNKVPPLFVVGAWVSVGVKTEQSIWRLIYSVAIKAGLSDADAQDVGQDTVLSVAKKIGEFKSDPALGSFKGWLMLITRRRPKKGLRGRANSIK